MAKTGLLCQDGDVFFINPRLVGQSPPVPTKRHTSYIRSLVTNGVKVRHFTIGDINYAIGSLFGLRRRMVNEEISRLTDLREYCKKNGIKLVTFGLLTTHRWYLRRVINKINASLGVLFANDWFADSGGLTSDGWHMTPDGHREVFNQLSFLLHMNIRSSK